MDSTVISIPERQVQEDTLKTLPTLLLPNTNSTTTLSHSMYLDIDLLTRSSDNDTYATIKQNIIEYINTNRPKPQLAQPVVK